jgi:hypothetical protein
MLHLVEKKLRDFDPSAGGFPFSRELFWDYPQLNIDLDKHAKFVVERVVTRGRLEDFYKLLKIYPKERIVECLKRSKELDAKTRHFVSDYFGIPVQELHVSSFYGRE